MSGGLAQVRLADLLRPAVREEPVDFSREYRLLGVHWYAKGLYVKETKVGSTIRASRLYRVEQGDFVYNRLFAWKGSFAIATDGAHGCHVSNEFPCFHIRTDRLNPGYLQWYFSREPAWNAALGLSYGATPTSRNRLKQEHLLGMRIPLPPLAEQRRIVAKIDQLAARIDEARGLRLQAADATGLLWRSGANALLQTVDRSRWVPLAELVSLHGGGTPSKANPAYWNGKVPWVCPRDMKRRDIFDSAAQISELAVRETNRTILAPGTVLVVVRGMILAHTVPAAVLRVPGAINQDMKGLSPCDRLLSEYLCTVLWGLNPDVLALVERSSHDTRKLLTERLLSFEVPVPAISEQRRIVGYLDDLQAKVDRLKALQAQTAAELDALLPSILDKAFKGEL